MGKVLSSCSTTYFILLTHCVTHTLHRSDPEPIVTPSNMDASEVSGTLRTIFVNLAKDSVA